MISILDYGAGNFRSVQNTLGAIGRANTNWSAMPMALRRATKIILPGVGHFGQMMRALDELGVREALVETHPRGRAVPGHLPGVAGAVRRRARRLPKNAAWGFIPARSGAFRAMCGFRTWAGIRLERVRESTLLRGTGDKPYVYFAHSYYAPVVAATAATCDYSAALHGGARTRQHVAACSFIRRNRGRLGLADRAQFRGEL